MLCFYNKHSGLHQTQNSYCLHIYFIENFKITINKLHAVPFFFRSYSNSLPCTEPEGPLPHSEEFSMLSCHMPSKSSPHIPTFFLKIHCKIILQPMHNKFAFLIFYMYVTWTAHFFLLELAIRRVQRHKNVLNP
jgi:hypothetical protein